MTNELKKRLAELEAELVTSTPAQREELMAHLEEVVTALEDKGVETPQWAKSRLNDRIDEDVEDQFDNMPL
ncbi:hypothetical protein [Tropicibacter oceani]|uniref:Uncharacterized protein n=1 Tax=Tropicibacter oceani TaxID=3058420 RepID=A0ABY8QGQ1_9RHOB|nr:hypothetical protein [Tropicibacter oceani]WGW03780.1 hypothetical protein QF118_17975 [Tropicibacter oceani]